MIRPILNESTRLHHCLRLARHKRSLWTPRYLSAVLGMDLDKVYDLIRQGEIPSVKINGAIFVHPRPLREWLRRMESYDGIIVLAYRRPFIARVVVVPPSHKVELPVAA